MTRREERPARDRGNPHRRRRRRRALIAWILVAPWVVWALGRVLGLDRGFPLVAIVAYTPYAAAAAVLCAVCVTAVLRCFAPAVLGFAAAAVLVAVLIPRLHPDGALDDGAVAGPTLRVLEANVYRGSVAPAVLVGLARRYHVDVLALVELTPQLARGLSAAGLNSVLPHRVAHPRARAMGTGLYARRRLVPQPPPLTSRVTSAALLSVPGDRPVEVYAVHPESPVSPPRAAAWRSDLRALPPASSPGALRILAGDFNATLDDHALRRLVSTGYQDAAEEAGTGLTPTFPAGKRIPPLITIDHVLADARCGVRSVQVLPLPGSDHKAVLATLVLPRGS